MTRLYLERPLPSEGRGRHGFDPFLAISRGLNSGTRREQCANKRTLHRTVTGDWNFARAAA